MNVCRENRELSWLKFNDRVLMQAKDPQVPLAEKLSFISIYQTNLDEFFMVRIGSLYDQMLFYPDSKDNKTGMTGLEQLKACLKKVHYLNKKKDRIYENVMSELGQSGWSVIKYKDIEVLPEEEVKKLLNKFSNLYENIIPVLFINTSFLKKETKEKLKNEKVIILDIKNILKMLDGRDILAEIDELK